MIKFIKRHLLISAIFLTFIATALLYTIQLLLNGGDPMAVLQQNAEMANHWLAWRVVLYSGMTAFYVYLVRRHTAQGNFEHVAYLGKIRNYGLLIMLANEISNYIGYFEG
ncbi:MAG: hypothetical protein KIG95_10570 [Comamonas sp.]|nr:hypothetical protein [Comamonas sp.]